jgi:hypothetical protein
MATIHAKEQPLKDIFSDNYAFRKPFIITQEVLHKSQWMYDDFAERQIQEVSERL